MFGIVLVQARRVCRNQNRRITIAQGVFAAGDCRRGQSLVVWSPAEPVQGRIVSLADFEAAGGLRQLALA